MNYDTGNTRRLVRLPVKFKEMGVPDYKRGPKIGEHGREVLEELGYSKEEIDNMLETKALFIK